MELLIWIVFGGLVGWVASMIMNTDSQQGIFLNIIVGIIGAFLGGWVMTMMGEQGVSGFNIYSFLVALVGAVALIGLVKLVKRN